MIKIRTLYIVLPLTILMAVGCYLKGWTAGIALWALLALVCVGRILRERKEKNGAEDASAAEIADDNEAETETDTPAGQADTQNGMRASEDSMQG